MGPSHTPRSNSIRIAKEKQMPPHLPPSDEYNEDQGASDDEPPQDLEIDEQENSIPLRSPIATCSRTGTLIKPPSRYGREDVM